MVSAGGVLGTGSLKLFRGAPNPRDRKDPVTWEAHGLVCHEDPLYYLALDYSELLASRLSLIRRSLLEMLRISHTH